jgi:hypothetical protein
MWTFPTNLQMLHGLHSMNKETENEMKIVDNNYKKEMLLLPLKILFKLFPGRKINKKLHIFLYLIHQSPDRVKNAILKMFQRVDKDGKCF